MLPPNEGYRNIANLRYSADCLLCCCIAILRHLTLTIGYYINVSVLAQDEVVLSTVEENPWQVSLEHFGTYHCGGALISLRWVVTSASCLSLSPDQITVRAGTSFAGHAWRVKEVHDGNHNQLMQMYPFLVAFLRCKILYYGAKTMTSNMFCAGHEMNVCRRDLGNAAVYEDDVLVGILVSGCDDDPKKPGIYTSVPAHVDWIRRISGI
nr:unnamed protein product [Callosobruchus analis]